MAQIPTSGWSRGNVTITTAAARIGTNAGNRQSIRVFNNSSAVTLYIGETNAVTTATGFPILPQDYLDLDIDGSVDVFGITSSTADVRWLEPRA